MKETEATFGKLRAVPFTKVKIEDTFWRPRLAANQKVTLRACLDQCERTGRISNFSKAAGLMEGGHLGLYFNDSDVYKVLEGIAYSIMNEPDADLEEAADRIIASIAAAQEPDGYLMTYFTIEAPDKKWTDMEKHEMYCGGHLIEAAVAYYHATGKRELLDVACRLADHYDSLFGPGKRHWVEGHEEIELALIKLFRTTGEEKYLRLALFLLEERGHGHGVGAIWDREDWGPAYCQDHLPVSRQTTVVGHAVRAMYLYAGMADAAAIAGMSGYVSALDSLWKHTTARNMYITGGIGPSRHNEGFTEDFDMPNETAYCETCASVGMLYWNHRMNLLHGDAKYIDVLERAMYNGVLAGVSLTGDKFFYVNPLGSQGDHHRTHWYDCSCCPTQLARFMPSVGNYIYAISDDSVFVNLYVQSEARIDFRDRDVKLRQQTSYPWDGRIRLSIEADAGAPFSVKLRIPSWAKSYSLTVNGQAIRQPPVDGYVDVRRDWRQGDVLALHLEMPVERIKAHPKVKANENRVAIQRGPIVYCIEGTDNGAQYDAIELDPTAPLVVEHCPDLLDGVTRIHGRGADSRPFVAVPYCAWDNREEGYMYVWIRERLYESAEPLYRA